MPQQNTNSRLSSCDFTYAFQFEKVDEHFDTLWQMKASARESLRDWLVASRIDPKISEVCANACSELIENCIKYTNDASIASVAIHVTDTVIMVETLNTTTPAHKRLLSTSLDEIKAVSNLKQIFVDKLLNPTEGVSHLGLIKVVMETKGVLELLPETDENIIHMRLRMDAKRSK